MMHLCLESGGPLGSDAWKRFVAGEELKYTVTRRGLRTGMDVYSCGLCKVLYGMPVRANTDSTPAVTYTLKYSPANSDLQVVKAGQIDMGYYLYTHEDDVAAGDVVKRPPCPSLRLEDACRLTAERMNDCVLNHRNCPKPKPVILPTRVVDCSDPTNPRLVTTNASLPGFYLTLSYVWGQETTHLTLKSNINQYHARIDPLTIPRTIRDAIHLTHGLGQQYLWVDAYCIIQDSTKDKNNELIRMEQIYRNAYLSIVAAKSPHSDAGISLEFHIPEYFNRHPIFAVPYEDGRVANIAIVDGFDHAEAAPSEPLDGRGWCFQEGFLAPRKLVCTSRYLEYQCHHGVVPVNNAIKWWSDNHDITSEYSLDNIDTSAWTEEHWSALGDNWAKAASNYTRRALSRPSDKLVAFAGVATQFSRLWGARSGRYVAGLWENYLLGDLLWQRVASSSSVETKAPPRDALHLNPKEYIAPSWSWASINGAVQVIPPSAATSRVCKILQCNFNLSDSRQPHGAVASARLKIRARVMVTPVFLSADPLQISAKMSHSLHVYVPTKKLIRVARKLRRADDSIPICRVPTEGNVGAAGELRSVPMIRRDDVMSMAPIAAAGYYDDTMLLERLARLILTYDTSEIVPLHRQHFIVIQDPPSQGIVVTEIGGEIYRRIGYWKLAYNWGIQEDVAPWQDLQSLKKMTLVLV